MAEIVRAAPIARARARRVLAGVLPERDGARWLLLGLASALLAAIWFGRNHHEALMGDDLVLLMQSRQPGGFAHSFWHGFTDVAADKWRPLVTPVQSVLTRAFDGSYQSWVYLLTVLEWLNVMGATALAWVLSGRRWLVAVAFAVALLTSRFNTYFVWQTFGLMEGMALSATLVCIACARMAWRTASRPWIVSTIVAAAAASLCHERYLCLLGFVVLVVLFMPGPARLVARLGWAGAALLVGVANYVVKVHLLHVDFFAGAAGVDVDPTVSSTAQFMRDGAWGLLGFVRGPSYLTGADARTLGSLPWLLTAVFVACGLALVVGALVRDGRGGWPRVRPWLLGPALLVPLLLVASISIRQEPRWLYAPQVVLLLGLAWAAGRLPRAASLAWAARRFALPATALTVAALFASAAVDVVYARHVNQVYFMTGQRMADTVLDRIVRQYRAELPTTTVFLLSEDTVFKTFYVLDGWFFRFYAAPTQPDVRFVAGPEEIPGAKDVRPNRLAFRVEVDQVVEVPVPAAKPAQRPKPRRIRAGG